MVPFKKVILNMFTYLIALIVFFPILWIALNAFKTENDAYSYPPKFFFQPILDNIINAFGSGQFLVFLKNSLVVSVISVFLVNLVALPLAFYLAELKWNKKKDRLFAWILSTKFMPVVGIVVPIHVVLNNLNMLNNVWGLTIIYAAVSMPIIVLVMRSFFLDIPYELIEAASIDGAGYPTIFFRIVLPIAVPGIVTSSLLAVILNYNEYFFATILTGPQSQTLSVYISSFMTSEGLFWAKVSGISLLSIIPILTLGTLAQKHIVRGLTLGAVKG